MYVDIRQFFNNDEDFLPTKKGIMLTIEQYEKLKELIPKIDQELP